MIQVNDDLYEVDFTFSDYYVIIYFDFYEDTISIRSYLRDKYDEDINKA